VEALIKCKMQDNLEFLQYAKRYWDQYYPGGEYDALGRRKASGAPSGGGGIAPRAGVPAGGARRPGAAATAGAPRTRTPGGSGGGSAQLSRLNEELKETVAGLERERDFYFSKLRDIELLIQQEMEAQPELEKDEGGILKRITDILYSTEVSYRPSLPRFLDF
jgi:microtubule-associated protein, RP/EB family